MAYGLKYQGEFDSITENTYRLEILEKDYTGNFYSLQMAGTPVIQNWNNDDPIAPIKGSALTIKYLNKGSQPIENFYSPNDDNFKVVFYRGTKILFVGFLVQDDFREPMVDYSHEVTLSANDGLGLLKDIALDITNEIDSVPCFAQGDFISITVPVQNWIYLTNINFTPVVGTPFTISGHPVAAMNGTFTPTVVTPLSSTKFNVRTNTFTGDTIIAPATINGTALIPLTNGRLTLASIVRDCLLKTGLELNTIIYANIFEQTNVTTTSFLHQTYIDPFTFYLSEAYDNCFSILEKICTTFKLTVFQSLGRWNIVRWSELRNGLINGFIYDKLFFYIGTENLPTNFLTGFNGNGFTTYPEAGLTKTFIRPYEFVKETFNYQQPKYLLKNYDLTKLGTLLRTYNVSSTIVKEYAATDWTDSFGSPGIERFIRVTTDLLGNELNRELVMRGTAFDTVRAVQSKPFEVSTGDKIKFSFSFRTNISQAGSINLNFAVRLFDGVNNRYVDEVPAGNGNWIPNIGFTYNIPSGDNTNQLHYVEIQSSQIPFDGFIYCYLSAAIGSTPSTAKETIYKDIRLEYVPYINDSTKIIGHTHKDSQALLIKNNSDTEISIDDSPRNSIQGTLFTAFFNGVVQTRTALWHVVDSAELKKIGNIIINDFLQYKSIGRVKLEGVMRGIIQSDIDISLLTWFTYGELLHLNFLFGNLEINYLRNQINFTGWELFNDLESDVVDSYNFKYLFSTT